jgi:hypothetical protein
MATVQGRSGRWNAALRITARSGSTELFYFPDRATEAEAVADRDRAAGEIRDILLVSPAGWYWPAGALGTGAIWTGDVSSWRAYVDGAA